MMGTDRQTDKRTWRQQPFGRRGRGLKTAAPPSWPNPYGSPDIPLMVSSHSAHHERLTPSEGYLHICQVSWNLQENLEDFSYKVMFNFQICHDPLAQTWQHCIWWSVSCNNIHVVFFSLLDVKNTKFNDHSPVISMSLLMLNWHFGNLQFFECDPRGGTPYMRLVGVNELRLLIGDRLTDGQMDSEKRIDYTTEPQWTDGENDKIQTNKRVDEIFAYLCDFSL